MRIEVKRRSLYKLIGCLGVALVLGLLICGALYVGVPDLRRRIDYLPRRLETWWRKLQPHPQYLPTPAPTPIIVPGTSQPIDSRPTITGPSPIRTATATLIPTRRPMPPSERTPTTTATPPPTEVITFTVGPIPSPVPSTPTTTATPPPAVAITFTAVPIATAVVDVLPQTVLLEGFRHEWQKWNNCGPATLAMALSYYGRPETQMEAAAFLKPNYDDKNVSPTEMAAYVRSLGLEAVVRHGGDVERLKRLLNGGFPVVVENWFIPEPGDEMGHYRLLIGYDDLAGHFITQDSYNGPNVTISYQALEEVWRVFNWVYLVVYRPEQAEDLRAIMGADLDDVTMYQRALERAQAALDDDAFAWFNVGTNQTGLGHYDEAAAAYDRARVLGLPWRMLWYQFGPFEAYYAAGRYQDVLDLARANLGTSKDLEESYYYRGLALEALGRIEEARQAYQTALHYNPNFRRAAEALAALD